MRNLSQPAVPGAAAPTCIVCLPGAYHEAREFLTAGFDHSVRRRRLAIDLELVDVDLLHLGDRSARQNLRSQIVQPLRARGCRALWIAGISLGGFIALDYAAAHPGELDGVCLIAPYLGNRMLAAEIAAAGLHAWAAKAVADADEERRLWRFVAAQPCDSRLLYLGFGSEDRFAGTHRLLAQTLPADSVDIVPGGHDWTAWHALWENFLEARFT